MISLLRQVILLLKLKEHCQNKFYKIMKIKFATSIVLSILFCFSITFAQLDEQFKTANENYKNENFDEAIKQYEQLIEQGYQGASLFYNLANSYYRKNKIGYAILYYEKALLLSPNDDDIKHNLALAKLRTVDKIEELPQFFLFNWWDSLLSVFSLTGWTIFAYVVFIGLIFSIMLYTFSSKPNYQKLAVLLGSILFVFLIISSSLIFIKYNREVNEKHGIVLSEVANVKLSPDEKSDDAFIIHEGLKVKFEDKVENWIEIRLTDGKVGWIKNSNVAEI